MAVGNNLPTHSIVVGWLGTPWRRRHPSSSLPPGSELADPPESLDDSAAKAALDQVHKRQDAQLALKTSTESRAMTLAQHSLIVLVAVTGAALAEVVSAAPRGVLIAAAVGGGICLFAAILCALQAARPRDFLLSGRLPDVLWDDLLAPDMKGPEFIARYIKSLQDGMARNELQQLARANALIRAVWFFIAAVPMAILFALGFHYT